MFVPVRCPGARSAVLREGEDDVARWGMRVVPDLETEFFGEGGEEGECGWGVYFRDFLDFLDFWGKRFWKNIIRVLGGFVVFPFEYYAAFAEVQVRKLGDGRTGD